MIPKILFMDEPTIGLDVNTRRLLWNLIKKINKVYGVTILLTTHYIEEADVLCDSLAIINHGKIIANWIYGGIEIVGGWRYS